jgi:hypothetical protein
MPKLCNSNATMGCQASAACEPFGMRRLWSIVVLFILTPPSVADPAATRTLSVKNDSSINLRLFLIQSEYQKSFCVSRIAPRQSANIRRISIGHWFVVAINLDAKMPVQAHPIELTAERTDADLVFSGASPHFTIDINHRESSNGSNPQ